MQSDPCQKLFNEWEKVADEAQRLKSEYDSGSVYKGLGDTVQKREEYAKYEIAKKRADQLHRALGKCYEKNGVIDS